MGNRPTAIPLDLTLHFDGSCTSNPGGLLRFGWHLDDGHGRRVAEESGPVGGYEKRERTNNTAEFEAALAGLEWVAAFRLFPIDVLSVAGDSQLVVRIMRGEWKAKKPHLRTLAERCEAAVRGIDAGHVEWKWVPREWNAEADRIGRRAV